MVSLIASLLSPCQLEQWWPSSAPSKPYLYQLTLLPTAQLYLSGSAFRSQLDQPTTIYSPSCSPGCGGLGSQLSAWKWSETARKARWGCGRRIPSACCPVCKGPSPLLEICIRRGKGFQLRIDLSWSIVCAALPPDSSQRRCCFHWVDHILSHCIVARRSNISIHVLLGQLPFAIVPFRIALPQLFGWSPAPHLGINLLSRIHVPPWCTFSLIQSAHKRKWWRDTPQWL